MAEDEDNDEYPGACPKCGSEPGEPCWSMRKLKGGDSDPHGGLLHPHRERLRALRDGAR